MRKLQLPQILMISILILLLVVACGNNENNAPLPGVGEFEEEEEPPPVVEAPPEAEGPIDVTTFRSGDVVYFTDFDDKGEEPDWSLLPFPSKADDYEVFIDDYSNMVFDIEETEVDLLALFDDEILFFPRNNADVYVEATAYNVGGNNLNYISVICRFSDDGFYMFSLMSGAKWYIWKYTFGKDWRKLLEGGVQNFDYDAEHTIAGKCEGDLLTLYVDGEEQAKAEYEDSTFRDGGVGMGVSAAGRETEVEILDFTVSIP